MLQTIWGKEENMFTQKHHRNVYRSRNMKTTTYFLLHARMRSYRDSARDYHKIFYDNEKNIIVSSY